MKSIASLVGVPGPKTAAMPFSLRKGMSSSGIDPSGHDEEVVRAFLGEEPHHAREELHMRARQDAHGDDVDVFLDGSLDDLLRSLPQAGIDHLHSRVAHRSSDYLGAPVVPIQARFGHEHSYLAIHRSLLRSRR